MTPEEAVEILMRYRFESRDMRGVRVTSVFHIESGECVHLGFHEARSQIIHPWLDSIATYEGVDRLAFRLALSAAETKKDGL